MEWVTRAGSMGGEGIGDGDQTCELLKAASLLWTARGLKAPSLPPRGVLSFTVSTKGQPGVIPSQPMLFKQNDAKSIPASQHSASSLSSLHLDTITEPAENGKKPSDPVHQQLLFIYPGFFLLRKDGSRGEALPTPSGLPLWG